MSERKRTVEDNALIKDEKTESREENVTWKDLGLENVLCRACKQLKWNSPTKIQRETIPLALKGRDVIGLAETGSGKTAAFALPILQSLLEDPQSSFALILTPTRELAFQISEQFDALGANMDLKTAVIVGGIDMESQSAVLAKRPHIIIATPGRLLDHLSNTKRFNLQALKYFVMDEADRILNMDFEVEIDKILSIIPEDRRTFLFSATMTKKVKKLQRVCLKDPVKVEVSIKYQTVEKLRQYYVFMPRHFKEIYLVHILNEMQGKSFIIFCSTCDNASNTASMLKILGLPAVLLHGQMSQTKRLLALTKFKEKSKAILVSTDVASRGLDIPHIDVVINFDLPTHSKEYIHRVGRTARAGRSGKAITFVSQYDVPSYKKIEDLVGKKFPLYKTEEDDVMTLQNRVTNALGKAKLEIQNIDENFKRKRSDDDEDDEDTGNTSSTKKRGKGNNKRKKKKGQKK